MTIRLPYFYFLPAMLFTHWAMTAHAEDKLMPADADPVVGEAAWPPAPKIDPKYDWIELTSGEWLKGEIKYMYDDELVFDSDILDDLTIDWDDIRRIYSSRRMSVRLNNRSTVAGQIQVADNRISIVGKDQSVAQNQVVALVPDVEGELDNWTIKASVGADFQSGNTDEVSYNASADIARRTADDRLKLSYIGQYTQNDGNLTASNQRGTVSYDIFIDEQIFIRPAFAQLYHDKFQNISFQGVIGAGIGYQIYDDKDLDWDVVIGPIYQYTNYDSVPVGRKNPVKTPGGLLITTVDYDITDDIEFNGTYQFIATRREAGLLGTHFVSKLSYDINDIFEVTLSFIWDRIQEPTPQADGTVPKQDDFQLILGLGVDY